MTYRAPIKDMLVAMKELAGSTPSTARFYGDHILAARRVCATASLTARPVSLEWRSTLSEHLCGNGEVAVKFLKIDFVSDITCPWCAIGLQALEQALARVGDELRAELRLHPFELNPDLPPEGEDIFEYAARKYGASATEMTDRQSLIRERAAAVGLRFGTRTRVWNTFDAHRLLHWAGLEGRQRELKHALLTAYHARGENPGDREVLLRAAAEAGLDVERARAVVISNEYADAVRAEQQHWRSLGIQGVPTIIVDERLLIQGGHPPEAFEQMLREIASSLTPA